MPIHFMFCDQSNTTEECQFLTCASLHGSMELLMKFPVADDNRQNSTPDKGDAGRTIHPSALTHLI